MLGEPIEMIEEKKKVETKLLVLVYVAVGSWKGLPEESETNPQHDSMLIFLLASRGNIDSLPPEAQPQSSGPAWVECEWQGEGPISALGWM